MQEACHCMHHFRFNELEYRSTTNRTQPHFPDQNMLAVAESKRQILLRLYIVMPLATAPDIMIEDPVVLRSGIMAMQISTFDPVSAGLAANCIFYVPETRQRHVSNNEQTNKQTSK